MNNMMIRNPRTGKEDFSLPVFEQENVAREVNALRKYQVNWQQYSVQERADIIVQLVAVLTKNKEELVNILVEDTGRYHESVLEVDVVIQSIQRWCEQAPEILGEQSETQANIPFLKIKQSQLPYEVVGIISPWNFPLLLSLVDAIPALLAGCSVLLKPSEITSRFVKPLQLLLMQVPELDHVFSIVTGAGKTGQAVIELVDSLCFTGSVATGRHVAVACAERFIPAFLELGGKDAALVCHDADVAVAAQSLCWGSMVNAGQSCMSLERVYVHQNIAKEFIAQITQRVEKLSHNYPDVTLGDIGPIISAKQVDIIEYQLRDAKAKGAIVQCGGAVVALGGGYYCQPTILTHVSHNMAIMQEETFAAILPIMAVESDEQAIEFANQANFGLSGAVFSQNVAYAETIANQMQAGAISINDASLTALVHEMEKQSFKLSGLGGSRMGAASIFRFVRKKAFIRNEGVQSPWWF